MSDVKTKIIHRIRGKGRGEVYASKDFLDLGSRASVDQALSRLVKLGTLHRVARGLYSYPRVSKTLGALSPDPDQVMQAVARKRGSRIQRSGAYAANALGLTTQVAGRLVYVTDSSPAKVRVGKQTLTLKQVSPRQLSARGLIGSIIHALNFMGKDGMTDDLVKRLRSTLSQADKRQLLDESRYAAGWITDAVKKVVEGQL